MNGNLNTADAPLVKPHHLKGVVAVIHLLVHTREVALQFQQQAGQRVGLALDVRELIVLNPQDATKIREKGLTLKDECIVVELGIGVLLFIVLVVDPADNLSDNNLKGDQSAGSSKLVHDDGAVHLVLLELTQQVINLLRLGNEIG